MVSQTRITTEERGRGRRERERKESYLRRIVLCYRSTLCVGLAVELGVRPLTSHDNHREDEREREREMVTG